MMKSIDAPPSPPPARHLLSRNCAHPITFGKLILKFYFSDSFPIHNIGAVCWTFVITSSQMFPNGC